MAVRKEKQAMTRETATEGEINNEKQSGEILTATIYCGVI